MNSFLALKSEVLSSRLATMKAFKAIVSNTDYLTSQAFLFEREGVADGKLLFCLLLCASGEDIFNKVRHIGLSSQDVFFDSSADIPGKILESLDFVIGELKEAQNLNILVAAFSQSALYIQSVGTNRAYLLREQKIMKLPISEQLLSGFMQDGDKLLLLNCNVDSDESGNEQTLVFSSDFAEELILENKEGLEAALDDLINQQRITFPLSVVVLDLTDETLPEQTKTLPRLRENPLKKIPFVKLTNYFKAVPVLIRRIWSLKFKYKVVIIFGLVLIISLSFGTFTFLAKDKISQDQIRLNLSEAQTKFAQAKDLGKSDPPRAKQLVDESQSIVGKVLSQNKSNSQALALKKQIEDSTPEILHIYKVDNFPVFLSLDLIKKDYTSKRLAFSIGELLLFDPNQKSLVVLSLENKTNRILAGERELGSVEAFSLNGDNGFTYSKDKGVVNIDIYSRKVLAGVKSEASWGHITDLYAFAGNFYLLDTVSGQIWKYFPIDNTFSDRQEYLKGEADFLGAKRMQIDGSIWVINSDSEVLKFTNGEMDSFSVQGLDQPFGKLSSFFVSSDTNYLYILDQGNSRVVLLEKNGKYHSQYQGDKLKTADDLVVDEKAKKLYLLESNKIYQLDLR